MAHLLSRPHATTVLATQFDARPLVVPGVLYRCAVAIRELLGALALVLVAPFVILAVGLPIAAVLRLLLWLVGL